jgi:lactoylglutathione lyase
VEPRALAAGREHLTPNVGHDQETAAHALPRLEVSRHTSGRGSQLVFFKAPGSEEEIELCKFDESGPVQVGPDLTHLAFEVDDIEAFGKHCREKGYPFADPPEKSGSGSIIAFLDAPEGYEIELIQRARS